MFFRFGGRAFLRLVAGVVFSVCAAPRGLSAAEGFPKQALQRRGETVRVEYTVPAPECVERRAPDGRLFTELKVPGSGHSAEAGRPDLPMLVDDIEVPPRGEVSVRVTARGARRSSTPHWVYPVQESIPKVPGARDRRRFAFDEAWYRGGGKPAVSAGGIPFSTTTYLVRGRRYVRVAASPYRFDPATRELVYPETVTIEAAAAVPALPAAAGPRPWPVLVLSVPLNGPEALASLNAMGADIKAVRDGEAVVYATEAERDAFLRAGLAAEVIAVQDPEADGGGRKAVPAGYHDWDQVQALLAGFVAARPDLCRVETIGTSTRGLPILAVCVSDNVGTEEAEPEVRFAGAIHGDEVVGTELCLRFVDALLTGYGTDARIRALVDSTEIWVVPVMNPDGFVAGTRYNAGGVDLNRSFPDGAVTAIGNVFTGPPMDTAGRPAEPAAVMAWSAAHCFTLSATFHTGALVANYPYDNDGRGSVYSPTPDEDVFVWLAETYSSNNPPMWASTQFPHGITNGAAWYMVQGGIQDWLYRYLGCMDLTLEISTSDRPSATALAALWEDNRGAMLAYCEAALTGIRGVVTDAAKGSPVRASIAVDGRASAVFSDPDLGDYYRLLRPGTYTVTVWAPGYRPKTVSGVVVAEGPATVLDVRLEPSAAGGGTPLIVVHHADHDAAFQAYRDQRLAEGFAVTQIRLTGTNTAENVRSRVREAYAATGARYVVLLGDVEKVPTFINTADGTTARSDLAYALLDPGETFDNYLGKDVGIGRISLDTTSELLEYVAKLAAFRAGPRHRDLTWVSGGSTSGDYDSPDGTHNYVLANHIDTARYHNQLFYRNVGSAAELTAYISAGTDGVVYSGHGSEDGWLRYGYDGADLAGLTNTLDAPVVFGHCCLTGSFQIDDCFAEEWLATKERAVAYVGGSQNTYWDEDDVLERREFQYFHEHRGASVAQALDWGLRQTAAAHPNSGEYYFTIYHVFGDPTVQLFGPSVEVTHTPLADTGSRAGPYVVEADVVSEAALQSVVLYWRTAPGAAFTPVPMAAVRGATYRGQIPGQPYGTEVQYYIEATAADSSAATHPEGAPANWNAFRVDLWIAHTPLGNTRDTAGPYLVQAGIEADAEVTAVLNWRAAGSPYTAVPMAREGSVYAAPIPGQPAGTVISYYLTASTADRYSASDPADAPASVHQFLVDTEAPVFAGLGAALAGDREVRLSWQAAADATGPVTYSIFRATWSGGQDFGAPLATTQGLAYTDTGLANGTGYFYVVRACDALGNAEDNFVERAATPRGPEPIYVWNLDTDPGWARDAAWAYGVPLGLGGAYHGNSDPTAGATGTAVFGYNLSGDYANNLSPRYLTAGPLDCSRISGASLRFQRWLNVEQPAYDLATIEVSTDGSTWYRLWENPSEITDSAWTLQVFDISAYADGRPAFYVRWGMGPTDGSWTFSGWNLDDIAIWGVPTEVPGFRLTLASVPRAGGTISAEPPPDANGQYADGTLVRLTPLPADRFAFTGWSGDAAGTEWPLEIEMTGDRTVYAHFQSDDVTPPEFAGLVSAIPGNGSVSLAWEPAADPLPPIGYEIFRAETPGGQVWDAPLATTEATSYTDRTVTNGITYYYVVRALDGAGNRDTNTVERAATPRAPQLIYAWNLDTNPGWTLGKTWAFGQPQGKGARQAGFPDPVRGYTGRFVLGVNLKGDYKNNLKPSYLVTAPIDCSGLTAAQLRYRRWLNVERMPADRAAVEVSTDGMSWHTLWQNESLVMDSAWQLQTLDLSAYADGCATVRLRWVMGPTNKFLRMSGWNLDDIEIWGVPVSRTAVRAAGQVAVDAAAPAGPADSAPPTGEGWRWTLALGGGVRAALVFGMAPAAREVGLRDGPPACPGAWLIGSSGDPCSEVILPRAETGEWFLDILPPAAEPVFLSWVAPAGLPPGYLMSMVEADDAGNPAPGGLAVDLLRAGEFTVPAGPPRRFRLRCAPEVCWEVVLEAGWNAFSLPVEAGLPGLPGGLAALQPWRYDGATAAFRPASDLHAGEGYVVYAPDTVRFVVAGEAARSPCLELAPGWNLVGVPVPLAAPPGAEAGVGPWLSCSPPDGRPRPAGALSPGSAYWVFSPRPIGLRLDVPQEADPLAP